MPPVVALALFGFIPLVLYLFNRYPAQRAVIVSFVAGYLFLPQPGFAGTLALVSGLPPYEKMSALSYIVLLGTVLFASNRISSFQPGWIDLPMLIWCLCPTVSQISNGLSPISPTTLQIITWGVPYFLGRIYFNDLAGLRQLAIGIFAGGMVYIPLCLLEMRIAPTLHLRIYGYHARPDFGQTMRYGGYRPTVLLEHGLWVGMWMMAATLIGLVLWRTGVIKKFWNYPMNWLVPVLFVTFILVKSTGAYLYLAMGIGVWFTAKWLRTALPILLLVVIMFGYIHIAATGSLYRNPQVAAFAATANSGGDNERAQSLAFRVYNEAMLSRKAQPRMMLGWGDSGGNRVYDETGKDISVTDSLWIIVYGQNGIIGLYTFMTMLLLPSLVFCLRYSPGTWSNRKVAPAASLALVLIFYTLDSLLNAMACPVFILVNGGLAGLVLKQPETNKVTRTRASLQKRSLVQQR
jgi:hypothetical protein